MNHVYVVQHENHLNDDDIKFIGVFESEQSALKAVESLCLVSGFSQTPDGFSIERYEIDIIHWQEGFVTLE